MASVDLSTFHGDLPTYFQAHSDLKSVVLPTTITNVALQHLPKGVERVDMSCCWKLTLADLKHLPGTVRHLDVSECSWLTSLEGLPKALQTLKIRHCKGLPADALKDLSHTVTSLDISLCPQLDKSCLPAGIEVTK